MNKPKTWEDLVELLEENNYTSAANCALVQTLGMRAHFKLYLKGNVVYINRYQVKKRWFQMCLDRYEELRKASMSVEVTSYYGDPGWKDCPNRIVAPYIPAIWIRGFPDRA